MFGKKNYNGITQSTTENLQLDAGAFFVNYDPASDTYASAKAAGKAIGITEGGGEFKASATLRQIAVDGGGTRTKGLTDVQEWECYLKVTFKELTKDNIKRALGLAESSNSEITGYEAITGKTNLSTSDFLQNITWVGCVSGSTKPIIIQVFNALNEDGMSLAVQDQADGKITCTFYGYNDISDYANDSVTPPFKILRPTSAASIVPSVATYDDNGDSENCRNIGVTLTASTLTAVKNGSTTLTENTAYTVSGNRIVILKSYLTTLTGTSATLKFETADDADPTLTVKLTDTSS